METVTNTTLLPIIDANSTSPWLILTVVGCVLIAVKALLSLITQLVIIFVLSAVALYLIKSWTEPSTFADCLRRLTSACTTSLSVISNGIVASHAFLTICLPVLKEHLSIYARKIHRSIDPSSFDHIVKATYNEFSGKSD